MTTTTQLRWLFNPELQSVTTCNFSSLVSYPDPLGNKETINGSLENKKNSSENGDREKEDIDLKIKQTDAENGDIDLKIEQTNADNVKSETQTETNANAMEVNSNENGKTPKSNSDSNEVDASVEAKTYEKASDEIHINGDEESQKASEEDGSGDSKKVSDKPDVTDIFGSGELIKEVKLAFHAVRIA